MQLIAINSLIALVFNLFIHWNWTKIRNVAWFNFFNILILLVFILFQVMKIYWLINWLIFLKCYCVLILFAVLCFIFESVWMSSDWLNRSSCSTLIHCLLDVNVVVWLCLDRLHSPSRWHVLELFCQCTEMFYSPSVEKYAFCSQFV